MGQQDASALRTALERLVHRTPFVPAEGGITAFISFEQMQEQQGVLAALPPSAPPTLDVERLATAIATEDGPGAAWCRNDLTSTEFAERLAAEYTRLQEQPHD